jgi:molecular chaperone GrpE
MKHREKEPEGAAEPAGDAPVEAKAEDGAAAAEAVLDAVRQRDEYLARWQRAQADFQNLRRRTQSDIDAAVRRSQQGLLEGILLALDQLELALAAPRPDAAVDSWVRGVELTRAELLRTLSNAGAQPMTGLAPGARFDPALHQAVATTPTAEHAPGTVLEVVRTGYTWGELVLRPAQVIVVAAPAAESAPGAEGRS